MDRSVSASDIAGFSEADWFGGLADGSAARLIAAASDLALVVDHDGIVRDLSYSSPDPLPAGMKGWIGQHWSELVTIESRGKVEALLRDATASGPTRGREINHRTSQDGRDIPIRYSAVRMDEGHVLAVGKDLRMVSSLQQKLVEAQLMLDREYARVRNVETRYRLLFQLSTEAILILEDATEKISEANAAAGGLLGQTSARLVGRSFSDLFDGQSAANIRKFVAAARTLGRSDPVRVRSADGDVELMASGSTFHQENATYLLVRLTAPAERAGVSAAPSRAQDAIMKMPDGFVLVDGQQRVLDANPAFLSLVELTSIERVKGARLDSWLGRPGVDAQLLISNLREYGWLKDFSTILRGEFGAIELVEVTGVAASDGDDPCYGLIVRAARRAQRPAQGSETFKSVEQLTELVGRVSLKELVRESTDLIEKLCIEAALKRTDDNRASAAQILGLSRQSLYSKLHRHGLLNDEEIVDDA